MKEKILLDTDIGNDIDDSVALAYLLRQPACELLGITTVSGEPLVRAKLASALCKSAGRDDIPIYPGVESPLCTPQKQAAAGKVQTDKLAGWPHETKFPEGEAIEFMRRTVRAHPHEVTLLCIGPMTNAALLFAVDAEIPKLLKRLVLMCGTFTYRYKGEPCLSEWNARCDPAATAMVYNAPVSHIVSVGLDVTSDVVMGREEVLARYDRGILKTVLDFSGILEGNRNEIVYHDPLAAAVIFDRGICRFKRGNVDAEYRNERLEGLTYFQPDENGKNEVALEVDRERFFEHYFSILEG
jgi:inosine-uridine nucleoside N-ribohydrolase